MLGVTDKVPPNVKFPLDVTEPLNVNPLTVPVPDTDVTVPGLPESTPDDIDKLLPTMIPPITVVEAVGKVYVDAPLITPLPFMVILVPSTLTPPNAVVLAVGSTNPLIVIEPEVDEILLVS